MFLFNINNTKPINTHSRNNFANGAENTGTYASSKDIYFTNPNNILCSQSRNIIVQNSYTTQSPDYVFSTRVDNVYNYPSYLDFGIQNIDTIRFNTILTRGLI